MKIVFFVSEYKPKDIHLSSQNGFKLGIQRNKILFMKRTSTYVPPVVELFSLAVEKGFANSFGAGITDYTKNYGDELDD